jgi:hypothetical protein
MFPRAKFQDITRGTVDTGKGTIFCCPDSYVVMYPVEKGSLMDIVAIKNIPPPTPDFKFMPLQHETNWIQPVTIEPMASDFAGWKYQSKYSYRISNALNDGPRMTTYQAQHMSKVASHLWEIVMARDRHIYRARNSGQRPLS